MFNCSGREDLKSLILNIVNLKLGVAAHACDPSRITEKNNLKLVGEASDWLSGSGYLTPSLVTRVLGLQAGTTESSNKCIFFLTLDFRDWGDGSAVKSSSCSCRISGTNMGAHNRP